MEEREEEDEEVVKKEEQEKDEEKQDMGEGRWRIVKAKLWPRLKEEY